MNKQRILIVDDNQNNLIAMLAILEEMKIQCDTALNGNEALFKIMEHQYSLLLLDVQMPEMDGFELASIINANEETSNIPIIFVTAINKETCHVIKGYDCGAIDYIFKPLNPEILQSKVRVLLELDSRNRELEEAYTNAYEQFVQLQMIMSAASEGIIGVDNNGKLTYVNAVAERLLKISDKTLNQYNISQLFDSSRHNVCTIDKLCKESGYVKDVETNLKACDGSSIPVSYSLDSVEESTGQHCGSVIVFRDLTRQKEVEDKLIRLSNYDSLTALPNRTLFHEYIHCAIKQASQNNSLTALLLLDVDNFRQLNEILGNANGDKLLISLSERLENTAKSNELLSRLGGNEFGIILPLVNDLDEINERIECFKQEIIRKFSINGRELSLSCSIGIATSDEVEGNVEQLIAAAGIALQQAKEDGKGSVRYYCEKMHKLNTMHFDIKMRLTELILTKGFELHYQPKVEAQTCQITGAEALIRWPSDAQNPVGPQVFIPIAEKTGQINELGHWVLQSGICQLAKWQSKGLLKEGFTLSLNISTIQLLDDLFADTVAQLLKKYNVDSRYLDIEITESAVMYEPAKSIANLTAIHELGVSISIDDFGTGYSSLSYLTSLPIDILKIDKSFIDYIGCGRNEEKVVNSIINLSRSLRLKTIAEGVETEQQHQFLRKAGCHTIQGYLFFKPQKESDFTEILAQSMPLEVV